MNLLQLLAAQLAAVIGVLIGWVVVKIASNLFPLFPALAVALAAICFLTLTWPIMRLFSTRPILWICPMCGKMLYGPNCSAERNEDGLVIGCNVCRRRFLWVGQWRKVGNDHELFRCDPRVLAVLDWNGRYGSVRRIARWPQFFVRWKVYDYFAAERKPGPPVTMRQALEPLLPRLRDKYGLKVVWEKEGTWSSKVMLANEQTALQFELDKKERWITAAVLPASIALTLLPPDQSRTDWHVDIVPYSKSLYKIIEERTGVREFERGTGAWRSTLPKAMAKLIKQLERVVPDLMRGTQSGNNADDW